MSETASAHNTYWHTYSGKIVLIDGIQHRLRVREYTARYPREERRIDVSAEPVSKSSRYYRETKQSLGDDWSIDVLDSDCELQVAILEQLGYFLDNPAI